MRVLIVGGTGLTGGAMAARLRADGHAVWRLARGVTAADDVDGAARIIADRRDPEALARACDQVRPDAIIDQIAFTGADVDQIAALRPGRHLVCSSAAVLGAGHDLDEDAPVPTSANPYLAGKLAVEDRAAAVGAIVLRPTYLYGPGHPPMTVRGREPRLHQRLRAGEVLDLPDDDALPLQPIFAADYAAAVAAILAEPHPAPRYHVAGPATTWRGWLTALADAAGVPLRARAVPADELVATSFWFREYLQHPLTVRSRRLPTRTFTPLVDGARALIAWLDRVTPPA